MKIILLLVCMHIFNCTLKAQSPEDSVKTVINGLFTGMINADSLALKNVFSETATLQTVVVDKEGKTLVENEPLTHFISLIGGLAKGDADERIQFDILRIDGPLAIAWAPYQLFYKGKFSHCGVDSFQLVRVNGTWKIQYIIDTRRKDGCK